MTETELVFTQVLNCNRASLYLNKGRVLNRKESALISAVLKRRIKGQPLQYILGQTEFMGLKFKLTPDVFIPRPETEILVETAMSIVHSSQFTVHSILDIGVGSGCVAISLAKSLKNVDVYGIDISKEALKVAEQNALLNKVKINFMQSDLFLNQQLRTINYELIISNPPYIPSADIENLQPELHYEPSVSLDGGRDGLDFYRKIISSAPNYLSADGFLVMEMGFNQAQTVKELFYSSKKFDIIKVVKDYQGIDRVIVAELVK